MKILRTSFLETKTYITILVLILAFSACKEIPPFIDYSVPIKLAKDTTYLTTTLPSAQKKNTLIEDISGVRCVNCPEAAEIAHDIKDKYDEGRVVVLTLHSTKFNNFTRPISDTFNTSEATQIIDNLIGVPNGLPNGSIDRKIFDGKTEAVISPFTWAGYADEQLKLNADVNVELEVIPDASTRKVIANVKSTFLKDLPEGAYLSVFVSESHIISEQAFTTGIKTDFEHNSILRKGITPYNGLKLAATIESGRVFEKGFEFDIPEKWVFDNCSIVVMVNLVSSGDNQVLQCAEAGLKL